MAELTYSFLEAGSAFLRRTSLESLLLRGRMHGEISPPTDGVNMIAEDPGQEPAQPEQSFWT